jgi:signal recognition particle subunit SRP54
MFENLSQKFSELFGKLYNKGRLTATDIDEAMNEVRRALLEADVNFQIVRTLIAEIREAAIGTNVLDGISPGQQLVKIVYDQLVSLLGSETRPLVSNPHPPSVILVAGLQGSGKTTTAAKLSLLLKRQKQSVLMVPADLRRPAAIEQLTTLGRQVDVPVYQSKLTNSSQLLQIASQALEHAKHLGSNWVIFDTAGRLHIDEALMDELVALKQITAPIETLLVLDAMAGQDAIHAASEFHNRLKLTGLILTKLDSDTRGGAAITAAKTTGVPVKFIGVGEKLDALELFQPNRMASRILGMGDVLTLVEKAQEQVDEESLKELQRKIRKSQFDLEDFLSQIRQLQNMGPIHSLLGMLPQALRSKLPTDEIDAGRIKHLEAIISSMTLHERRNPIILEGSRRKRIAVGSGSSVQEVNQVLNQFRQMQKTMRQLSTGRSGGQRKFPPGL